MNRVLIFVILGCVTAGLCFALMSSRSDLVQSFFHSRIYTEIREYFSDGDNDKNKQQDKIKEYSFSDSQVSHAKKKVLDAQKLKDSSEINSNQKTNDDLSGGYLYEIEFSSGRTVAANSISVAGDMVTFESNSGLVTSVSKNEVKAVRQLSMNFSCTGKIKCFEMSSCEEAMFYLRNCPGVKIDGDGDGVPCEDQWCGK